MSLRYQLSNLVGCVLKMLLNRLGRGSALPGKWALKIDPNFIHHAASRQTVLITGTNGKTMTTNLLVQALEEAGIKVRTNHGGANMKQGIATALLGPKFHHKRLSVLEVDEATMPLVAGDLGADLVILTNLFQDQNERYSNPKATLGLIQKALKQLPDALIIANGELPLFHPTSLGRKAYYYGLGSKALVGDEGEGICPVCASSLDYHLHAYADLGKYACLNCGLETPSLDLVLDNPPKLELKGSEFELEGRSYHLPAAGLYNVVNAIGAYAGAKALGLDPEYVQEAFRKMGQVGGRQERVNIAGKEITLHLMKNPVGFNQIVDLLKLDPEPFGLILMLNDRPADGMDITWIEDADFASLLLLSQGKILVGGLRGEDLAKHLESQGGKDLETFRNFEVLSEAIEKVSEHRFHMLLTYTALSDFKAWLDGGGRS